MVFTISWPLIFIMVTVVTVHQLRLNYTIVMRTRQVIFAMLAMIGLADAAFLTYESLSGFIPPCSNNLFVDCGKVLQSSYAHVAGIPLSMVGVAYYAVLIVCTVMILSPIARKVRQFLIVLSALGLGMSVYFVFLQVAVIKAICLYCMLSAGITTAIFILARAWFPDERRQLVLGLFATVYVHILKRLFFMIPPEVMHERMTYAGERMGERPLMKYAFSHIFWAEYPVLRQSLAGISFDTPVGLAAGFDYKARLTQILPSLGFGFQTVGTITNMPYEGNPSPMLGRLPKSKSLMVNKGFKNEGAPAIAAKLSGMSFGIPVGISIGRTNSLVLKTQRESIEDIIQAFATFEGSDVDHSYYELNISCPNLYGDVTFYPPNNLDELLREVDGLALSRPVFMKMPIEKPDHDVMEMLKVIETHSPAGVIFGNLQKNRKDPALVQSEVRRFKVGNFSGKPTFRRSNELIELTYKEYGSRFVIIGCGGVFSGADAYAKIQRGASLIQLITGMIFQGPQLIAQINQELNELLKRDGFATISEAVGSGVS